MCNFKKYKNYQNLNFIINVLFQISMNMLINKFILPHGVFIFYI